MITSPDTAELADALAIAELPPEEQEEILLDIGEIVFEGAILRMAEQMDAPTRAAFETLLEQEPTDEQVDAFVQRHVPNADQLVQETIADLRSDILGVTGTRTA